MLKTTTPLTEIHDRFTSWWDALGYFEANYGSRPALEIKRSQEGWSALTYAELCGKARTLARKLVFEGLKPGDRIAILSESRPEYAIAFLGAAAAGAVIVPLDSKLTETELQALVAHAEPQYFIASPAHEAVARRLHPEVLALAELAALAPEPVGAAFDVERGRDEALLISYTSGTSGSPKGVVLTSGNILFDIQAQFRVLPAGRDTYLSILPLNHLFELTCGLMRPLWSGSTVYYSHSLLPTEIRGILKEKRIKSMLTVPLFLRGLKKSVERELNSTPARARYLKIASALARLLPFQAVKRRLFRPVLETFGGKLDCFVCGGAALEKEVADFFHLMGIHVLQGYGLTETSPTTTVNTFSNNRHGTVGRPLPGTEIQVSEANDGGEGEILIRGPHLMKGYFKRPDLTAEAIDTEGWFHTGDIGRVDEGGYLRITGRAKELIVLANGKKVTPEEVEEGLSSSLSLKEVCVLSLKADRGIKKGIEEVCAVVVPSDELWSRAEALMEAQAEREGWISEQLQEEIKRLSEAMAVYKRPSRLVIFPQGTELPKTTTRKVKRQNLREQLGTRPDLRFESL